MGVYDSDVQKLYVAYFNRPADTNGLAYWNDQIAKNGGSITAVASAFAASDEYKNLYAGKTTYQIINTIYNNLFGRSAEPDGLAYWGSRLDNGTIKIGTIAYSVYVGAQNADKTAIVNKAAAAVAWTAALDTSEEIVGYAGPAANTIAKDWLTTVTTNASLDTAKASLNTTVASAVAASNGSTGSTFTLTTGANNFKDTAGNDTFTVLTINADGAAASTLTPFDSIDGGEGTDTLNIYTEVNVQHETKLNAVMPATATVKNVEIINIYNTDEAADLGDASKFAGVTQLWQHGTADAVTNLAVGTTAGFKNISTDVSAAAAKGVASIAVALDGLADTKQTIVNGQLIEEDTRVTVSGDALNAVTVTGTVKDGIDENTKVGKIELAASVGKDVQTLTLNSAVDATVTVTTSSITKPFTTLDASGSTGAIEFDGTSVYLNDQNKLDFNYKVATIKTGSGNDDVTLKAETKAASGSTAAVSATVDTGAGNDSIFVNTNAKDDQSANPLFLSSGTTTVEAGAGDDNVTIFTRSAGKLTVNLGDGTDSFTSLVAIGGTDAIDAGAGVDTLFLSLVGASNVGAFSNFDVFDVKGMGADLDMKILNTKNTVAEIVGSGATDNDVELRNVGAGVNFRATADMTTASTPATVKTVTLTQKTAGALTVTLDADETGSADEAIDSATTAVKALYATSLKAVFDTSYLATISGEKPDGDNVSTINLTTKAAASISVVSGGENTQNRLMVTERQGTDQLTDGPDALTTVTVTGAQALDLVVEDASKLATIDASAATGGLVASLGALKDTGTIKLGTGTDFITAITNSTGKSIQNFEKTAAVSVSATASTEAKEQAIKAADKIVLDSGMDVAADKNMVGGKISEGVLSFSGTGPATLQKAIEIANDGTADNRAVIFEYVGDSYVFINAGNNDIVVELTGITGVTNFVEDTNTNLFFIV